MSERYRYDRPQEKTHRQESLSIAKADINELIDFFRDGYGSAYKGDERLRKKIIRASHVVTLREDKGDGIAAAALVEGARILTPSTSPDRERYGARQLNMVRLLQACFDEVGARWITIGEQYDRMQAAALGAGMQRANETDLIQGLLREAGSDDSYNIQEDDKNSLIVIKVASETRPDYRQQLWVYLPEIDLRQDSTGA